MTAKHKKGFYEKYIKIPQDVIIAFVALIVFSPVLLIVAILVRTKLGSPVIFKQERPGINGKIFKLYKFRTMSDERDENGELLPDAVRLTKAKAPNAYFHCDAVQAFGKMPINVQKLGVDMLTASAHKIHGPKGVGFLYKSQKCHIAPFITGGGQESGMRSGTEAVPLIAGLLGAVEDLPNLETTLLKMREVYNCAKQRLIENDIAVINSFDEGLPYILNISVLGYKSETLLHFLESKQIFVSSGSACAKGNQSYVLKEMGLSDKNIDSMLRISFCRDTTKNDIDALCDALTTAKSQIRKV